MNINESLGEKPGQEVRTLVSRGSQKNLQGDAQHLGDFRSVKATGGTQG